MNAITNVNGMGLKPIMTITADGNTTFSAILDQFFVKISDVSTFARFSETAASTERFANLTIYTPGALMEFDMTTGRTTGYNGRTYMIRQTGSTYILVEANVGTDKSSTKPQSGWVYTLYA